MPCKYYDCGWCYAPEGLATTDVNGACNMMQVCPQSVEIPAINLPVFPSAYNFYSDDTYNEEVERLHSDGEWCGSSDS